MTDRQPNGLRRDAMTGVSLSIRPLTGQRGLVVAGVADITTRSALHEALSGELAGRQGDVHLELADLQFIDVGCTREIITATAHHPGAHVIIPVVLRRIVSLIRPAAGIDMSGIDMSGIDMM